MIKGYALIKKSQTTGRSANPIEEFVGIPVRIQDINQQGDVLVMNPKATAIASLDACDVYRHFVCEDNGGVLIPKGLDPIAKMAAMTKRYTRKGGYPAILRRMIVANSLRLGKFSDDFIFEKQ